MSTEITDWVMRWDSQSEPFPFFEDENANITGYGHQDKARFAAEINRYDALCNGKSMADDEQWTEHDITHKWVVERGEYLATEVDGEPVNAATPGAIPITGLWGER